LIPRAVFKLKIGLPPTTSGLAEAGRTIGAAVTVGEVLVVKKT